MNHLTRIALQYPKTALTLLGLLTLAAALGVPRVHSAYGYRVLIGEDHAGIQRLDAFIARFGGGQPVQIAWPCGPGEPCADVFDPTSLAMAHDVSRRLAGSAGVRQVRSPSSEAILVPSAGGFALRRLVENGSAVADVYELATRALDDPLWTGAIIAKDRAAGAIVVQPADGLDSTNDQVLEAVDEALAPHRARGFTFHLNGDIPNGRVAGESLARSTSRLIPFTILVIGAVLLLLSGSLPITVVALATMGVTLVWTFGTLGWLGWPKDGVLEVLAPLVLIVGVCDAVHLLARYSTLAAIGPPAPDGSREASDRALIGAANELAGPCLLTTLTTAGAFLSFVAADLATFVRFGVISTVGVVAALVLTFSLLPLLVRLVPPCARQSHGTSVWWQARLLALLTACERSAVSLLLASAVLVGIALYGWIHFLRVDTNWVEAFGEKSPLVVTQRFIERHFGEASFLEIDIALPPDAPLEAPTTLTHLAELTRFVDRLEVTSSTRSILDIIRKANRLLHDDDPAYERTAESLRANAEILELVAFDDPDLLASWLSFDRSHVRISAGTPEQASSRRRQLVATVERFARSRLPASWDFVITGQTAMQAEWTMAIQSTQLRGFPIALSVVFVFVAIALGSLRLALAAMIPSVLPIVLTLGAMGWAGMSLDIGRAMIAAVVLGVAVDDSIHILRYYQQRRKLGCDPRHAIRAAIRHTGRAVVTTSFALSLGFLTLMLSAWHTIASFGLCVALAIQAALAASILVLPGLIFVFAPATARAEQLEWSVIGE